MKGNNTNNTNNKSKTPIVMVKKEKNANRTEDNIGFHKLKSPGNSSAIQFNPGFYNQFNMNVPNLDLMYGNDSENIKVCIRLRPLNMMETGRGDAKCVEVMNSQIVFQNKSINRNYGFNNVFPEVTTQEDVFYACQLDVRIFMI
jgi:hypothetical protein